MVHHLGNKRTTKQQHAGFHEAFKVTNTVASKTGTSEEVVMESSLATQDNANN